MKIPKAFGSQKYRKKFWEFVYLDNVAVQSLLATLNGGIVERKVRRNSASVSATSSLAARFTGGEAGTTLGWNQSKDREVHERVVAEALFAELRKELRRTGFMASTVKERPLSIKPSWGADRLLRKLIRRREAIDAAIMERGTPFEVEIRLQPPRLFLAAAALESTVGMARHVSKLAGEEGSAVDPEHLGALTQALSWFHSGTVPIKGTIESHCRYQPANSKAWYIVPSYAVEALMASGGGVIQPIPIAGFCDEQKFWEAPQRILRHEQVFNAFGRLVDVTPVTDWSDAEHLQDLRALSPEFESAARQAYDQAGAHVGDGWGQPAEKPNTLAEVLVRHSQNLEDVTGIDVSAVDVLAVCNQRLAQHPHATTEPAIRRTLLRQIEVLYGIDPAATALDLEELRARAEVNPAQGFALDHVDRETTPPAVWRVRFLSIYW